LLGGMNPTVIAPAEAARRLAAGGDFLLLDVRSPKEVVVACVAGATNLPMAEVPGRLAEIDRAKEVAVMCHHGVRSAQVAAYLASLGWPRVSSVAGGIDRWSTEVDPKIPRY
jgi:rhodanese-related sulfurtransferase